MANKSTMSFKPPVSSENDVDSFIKAAESKPSTKKPAQQPIKTLPWEEPSVRDDVIKSFNARFNEPYLLKLRYIQQQTKIPQQEFVRNNLYPLIDQEIERLLNQ